MRQRKMLITRADADAANEVLRKEAASLLLKGSDKAAALISVADALEMAASITIFGKRA